MQILWCVSSYLSIYLLKPVKYLHSLSVKGWKQKKKRNKLEWQQTCSFPLHAPPRFHWPVTHHTFNGHTFKIVLPLVAGGLTSGNTLPWSGWRRCIGNCGRVDKRIQVWACVSVCLCMHVWDYMCENNFAKWCNCGRSPPFFVVFFFTAAAKTRGKVFG